jgi:hypothetical protein
LEIIGDLRGKENSIEKVDFIKEMLKWSGERIQLYLSMLL